jgi:hypothetical protein
MQAPGVEEHPGAALARTLSHRPSGIPTAGGPCGAGLARHLSVMSEQVQGLIAEAAAPPPPPSLLSLAEAVALVAVGALLALYAPTSVGWRAAGAWLLVECAAYVAFKSR